MIRKFCFLLISIFLLSSSEIKSQGCSDAGFCTLHGIKPESNPKESLSNFLNIGVSYGKADYSTNAVGYYFNYNRRFGKYINADLKVTALSQSGNDISEFGMSDIFVSGSYTVSKEASFTVGTKIPLSKSDKSSDSLPLPMNYQSSLGTFDLIAGFSYSIKKLNLSIAYQQPLTQNENKFIAEDYPADSPLREFQSTNEFERSGDVLFRASYVINAGKNFIITPGILPIFHLGNDKFTDKDGKQQEIEGSNGLTFNINLYVDYLINPNNAFQLNAGFPVITRDSRPEGLARSFVGTIEYKISF